MKSIFSSQSSKDMFGSGFSITNTGFIQRRRLLQSCVLCEQISGNSNQMDIWMCSLKFGSSKYMKHVTINKFEIKVRPSENVETTGLKDSGWSFKNFNATREVRPKISLLIQMLFCITDILCVLKNKIR